MKTWLSACKLLALGCALGLAAPAAAEVEVVKDIPFAKGLEVRDAVRNECQLGSKLASFIAQYGSDVKLVDKLSGAKVLDVKITELHAPGGGGFSGPRWMEARGTLKQGGKAVASFRVKRFTTGGAFAAFKGTCAILGRLPKAMGQDIARWLENPTDNAELGDAR